MKTLESLLNQETFKPEGIPIPQANDLNKFLELIDFLHGRELTKFKIAEHLNFSDRQGDYYGLAGCYLKLLEKDINNYRLTDSGKKISSTISFPEKKNLLINSILKTPLFNELERLYLNQNGLISKDQFIDRIINEGYNSTTALRRKSTVAAWLRWININYN